MRIQLTVEILPSRKPKNFADDIGWALDHLPSVLSAWNAMFPKERAPEPMHRPSTMDEMLARLGFVPFTPRRDAATWSCCDRPVTASHADECPFRGTSATAHRDRDAEDFVGRKA